MAEAAIQAGCDAYFGYPITPQAELLEWMARRMPELGRVFVQAESELGAINMGLGAAATGARVLVSSSSPGISLMAEAMSYMAGSELPLVLINVMRGGPGLGSIGPSQTDYFQATKGHGHGDYRVPVLAPSSIAEAVALVADAFEIAERYRTPVDDPRRRRPGPGDGAGRPGLPDAGLRPAFDWALTGADGRAPARRPLAPPPARGARATTTDTCRRSTRPIAEREVRWADRAARRRGDRDRRLRHRGPRRADRDRARPRARPRGRPLPADHAVAVPDRRAGRARAEAPRASSSSSCPPARWSRTSGWRVGRRTPVLLPRPDRRHGPDARRGRRRAPPEPGRSPTRRGTGRGDRDGQAHDRPPRR